MQEPTTQLQNIATIAKQAVELLYVIFSKAKRGEI